MSGRIGLSKSRIALFEQCPKRLWLSVNRPEEAVETDAVRFGFSEGHRVGDIARELEPGGHLVSDENGLQVAIDETADLLSSGWSKPLYEATFEHDGVVVRVDLMLPADGGWHVAEVKSTTRAKPYQLSDLATQLWVLRGAGVNVVRASIRHLDTNFTLVREEEFQGLLIDSHAGDEIEPAIDIRGDIAVSARNILALENEPDIDMGPHCNDPFTCSFKTWCGRHAPPSPPWPVSLLPDAKGKELARHLTANGVLDLTEVPADAMPNPKLERIHKATVTGEIYLDSKAILRETASWAWPRTSLDFETIQFVIPRWIGTRPYQQIPFQFSAHIVEEDGSVRHHEFLSLEGSDPRRVCTEALVALPTGEGAIIAWSASFERSRLRELASEFPDLAEDLEAMAARVVDLLPVVRRHYYHRDMRGSWSIKAVLPTVAPELAYEGLDNVQSGTEAQSGYLEAINPGTEQGRKEELRASLLDYCERDTEAVLVILDCLTPE